MIRLEGLGQHYTEAGLPRNGWVFRGIDWQLAPSRSAVLLGPSGCGKTTLLRLLAGLETPSEGTVQVASPRLGMLFQRNALFDSLSVEENLLFPLREKLGVRGEEARTRARRWLESVGLPGTEALFPRDLSGGMQKRLGIARALIVEPEVVLCDDPTAGLDPITSRTIGELLLGLTRGSGVTAVIVTNDVDRALEMGDEIHLLTDGEWVPGGATSEIRSHPDPRIQNFFRGLA